MNSAGQPNYAPAQSDLQEMLTYMFKDAAWLKKLIIGAVVLLIPIVNFAAWGYAMRVLENIRDRNEGPLPEWGDRFGWMWGDGLKLAFIQLLYAIPIIIVSIIMTIPMLATSGSSEPTAISGAAMAVTAVGGLLIFIYAIALVFVLQGAFVNYANEAHHISAAFQFQRILEIVRRNIGRMLLIVGLSIVLGLVSGALWMIPCIGWIAGAIVALFGGIYFLLVMAYNTGVIARNP